MADETTGHNQAAYDRIAALYAERQAGLGRVFTDVRAAFFACLPPVGTVADLGCGPARDGAILAEAGHRMAGIDRSAGMLAQAANLLPRRVAQADLRSLPLASGSLDGIWCAAALLHVPHGQTMSVLGEMHRVLRRDGRLALITAAGQGTRLEEVSYAPGIRRWFFYRDPGQLTEQLGHAAFSVSSVTEEATSRHWVKILAHAA